MAGSYWCSREIFSSAVRRDSRSSIRVARGSDGSRNGGGAAAIGTGDQRVHQAFTSMAARSPSLIMLKQIEVMKIITPGSAARTGFT